MIHQQCQIPSGVKGKFIILFVALELILESLLHVWCLENELCVVTKDHIQGERRRQNAQDLFFQ